MKSVYLFICAATLAAGSLASAKAMRFTYPCKAYNYEGEVGNQHEIAVQHPEAKKYTFVKTSAPVENPKAGAPKWENSYSIEITLKAGGKVSLPLVHSGTGDEGYESYHIPREEYAAQITQFWISSGSINNDGSGATFEGEKGADNVFYDCSKN